MPILRLVLGDQLNYDHPWFDEVSDEVTYLMVEAYSETDYTVHHLQKLTAFFNAMRNFAQTKKADGHDFTYIHLHEHKERKSLTEVVREVVAQKDFTAFEYQLPDEYRMDDSLKALKDDLDIPVKAVDSHHFFTQRTDVADFFKGKKQYLLEYFYRNLRKKHHYLTEDGKPEGGKWNFDKANRKSYDGKVTIPKPLTFNQKQTDLQAYFDEHGVKYLGSAQQSSHWPTNRKEALRQLAHFCENALPFFGHYQDALTTESETLFHSLLSFAMNVKLISPKEVVEKAINTYHKKPKSIDIAQIEGFVRQILGWREYMRGVYWAKMPEYAKNNFFEFKRDLPDFYWSGKTKMKCLSSCIKQSLDTSYAHHIQRLMVTGNFALLNQTRPEAINQWYLGIYADAIEWVQLPNTHGMSQFADGGIVASKPYISSASYINKMSNYCSQCPYDHKAKVGEKACPFNSLYWNFLHQNRETLAKNQRMRMMYATWDKMKDKEAILKQATQNLENVNDL